MKLTYSEPVQGLGRLWKVTVTREDGVVVLIRTMTTKAKITKWVKEEQK